MTMTFTVSTLDSWNTHKADLLAIGVLNQKLAAGSAGAAIDRALGGALSRALEKEGFKGKVGTSRAVASLGKIPPAHILLVGLGDEKDLALDTLRRAGGELANAGKAFSAKRAAFILPPNKALETIDQAQVLIEGLLLGAYAFTQFKGQQEKPSPRIQSLSLLVEGSAKRAAIKAAMDTGRILAEATLLARDLVNTPARDMTPRKLAEAARAMARRTPGVKVKTLERPALERLKMGSYLSVADGSAHPPVFVEMTYKPKKKARKVLAVVGKGVTFDSGGLSLKPPKHMETMKCDMAGGAAAIAFMQVVGTLKPDIEVRAYVPATENMPDAKATRPGDVVRAMNGKTIEILNTDAEGRLTLADALHYALIQKPKPDCIVDLATLTGAALAALGERCSAALGTDPSLIEKLKQAGERAGERIWELPLISDYAEGFKSGVADLQNVSNCPAGTINGGLFLKEFVGDAKWVHLDIAGPAWTDKPLPYTPKGGTGAMVRTLWELVRIL